MITPRFEVHVTQRRQIDHPLCQPVGLDKCVRSKFGDIHLHIILRRTASLETVEKWTVCAVSLGEEQIGEYLGQ